MKKNFNLLGLLLLITLISPTEFVYPQTRSDSEIIESLEFREVDIKDVLRQLAKQFNLNIVFSEAVKGLVTVQLSNVSIEQALDSIITVNGFAYTKKENVYKVTTPEEAEREGKQTRLFKLNNADAVKLKDTLKKVLTSDGSIEADSRSNSLVVTDSLAVINKIEELMPQLDEITSQVLIEAKLIETSLTNTEKLGIDWSTTIAAAGSKRLTTAPFKKWGSDKDMYPVPGGTKSYTPGDYEYVQDMTTWVANPNEDPDTPGDEFIHPYVRKDKPSKSTVTSGFPFRPDVVTSLDQLQNLQFGSFPVAAASYFTFGTLDFTALKAVFDFLKTRSDTKLVANPRIVTLNNQEASINVGRKVPLPTYTIDATTGVTTVSGWQELNVGVNLKVTPQVNPAGYIKLKLSPKVDEFTGEWIGTLQDRRPITSTREASTEVQIKDGQTVVIGGLVKNKTTKSVKKIPILGDIPILGLFFTREVAGTEANPREQTDLLIFVTARIIKDTNESLLAWESNLVTSPPRPFKLETREVK